MESPIQFKDDDDIIEICKDNVFKAVFTKETPESRNALSCLVSALICRKVDVVAILVNELPINSLYDRQVRFDINCKTDEGEFVNVEMFYDPNPFEPVRLEYHAGRLFTAQDIKGTEKDYSDLLRVYQISILASKRFFTDESFYHAFEYYDSKNNVSLNGKTQIITLELSKLENVVKKPTNEMDTKEYWAVYFRYLTDRKKRRIINEIVKNEEGIAMASEVIMTISKDIEERLRLMSEDKALLDAQSRLVRAKREGEKIGKQEIIDLLKNGVKPEEIISQYEQRGEYVQ